MSSLQVGRRAPVDLLQGEDDAGQRLADLVVQLAGDAQPLGLGGRERAAGAALALGLEAVEHVVEGRGQLAHLGGGLADRHAAAGIVRVDAAHRARQPLERDEDAPQQQRR